MTGRSNKLGMAERPDHESEMAFVPGHPDYPDAKERLHFALSRIYAESGASLRSMGVSREDMQRIHDLAESALGGDHV